MVEVGCVVVVVVGVEEDAGGGPREGELALRGLLAGSLKLDVDFACGEAEGPMEETSFSSMMRNKA
jgi:hypothetical protein